jgi:outer membrane autotransporter protein
MNKIALALASTLVTAPAFAGPYVNVESNASYTGSDYKSRTTDFHVGWEGGNDTFDYYVQGGPALVSDDATDGTTELSGKVGANIAATDKLGFYGEVSVLTDEDADNSWGTKIGAKYSF